MPEGDTVLRTARRLDAALRGRVVTGSDLRWPSLATVDLRGTTTLEVVARGKHVLHRFGDGRTLHSHLRMEGQWRVEATGAESASTWLRNPGLRAAVATEEWTALGLRLGMLDLVPTREEHTVVGHLGPDILGPDWSTDTALDNLGRAVEGGTDIGAALLDQRNLAGIGTLWASESLFLERVGPWTRPDRDTIGRVVERARRLMTATLPHAVQSSTGIRRQGETSYVHGRSGRPCRRCGETVRVASSQPPPRDRTMFYCPSCQGGIAPHDDGRTQRPLGSSPVTSRGRRRRE